MGQGGYVTVVGYVAREPRMHETKNGVLVADVRVGTSDRKLDRTTGEWRVTDTSYYTVNCWRRLASSVMGSLRKGDPVIVKGRFRTRSYQDNQGRPRVEVEITADTMGHDLTRGSAHFVRTDRSAETGLGEFAPSAPSAAIGESIGDLDIDGTPYIAARGLIDEQAVAEFGRVHESELTEAEDMARRHEDSGLGGQDPGDQSQADQVFGAREGSEPERDETPVVPF